MKVIKEQDASMMLCPFNAGLSPTGEDDGLNCGHGLNCCHTVLCLAWTRVQENGDGGKSVGYCERLLEPK